MGDKGRASLVAQMAKNLCAIWETRIWFLDQKDALEKRVATLSSTIAWRIPRTDRNLAGSIGYQRIENDWETNMEEKKKFYHL